MQRPCLWRDPVTKVGCSHLISSGSYCAEHKPAGHRPDTTQWRRLRRRALQRDRYRCVRCGRRRPTRLEVHHVNGVTTDDRLENLETLCETCHRAADRALGVWR